MNGPLHNESLAEAYVLGKLSKAEKEAFEKQMETDEALTREVEANRLIQSATLELELSQLGKKIQKDLDLYERKISLKKWLFGSALLLVVGTLSYYAYLQSVEKEVPTAPSPISTTNTIGQVPSHSPKPAPATNPLESKVITSLKPQDKQSYTIDSGTAPLPIPLKNVQEGSKVAHQELPAHSTSPLSFNHELPTQVNRVSNPCDLPLGEKTKIFSEPSEKGLYNGSVHVQISGNDAAAWTFSLRSDGDFQKEPQFAGLGQGSYTVIGKNKDGCLYTLGSTYIKETLCQKEYAKTYQPDSDGEWNVPILEGTEAHVQIINKTGELVFENQGFAQKGLTWNGLSNHGSSAPMGAYKVFLTFKEGETCIASLTLLR